MDRAIWASQQAGRLTQQMLSFARRQFQDNRAVDLNRLIADFDNILQQMAGDGMSLALELAPEPMMVELDAGQLEMALLNLVRNAADAMPEGGAIVIKTHRRRGDGPNSTGAIQVSVVDAGTGMTPEVVSRAVEPFFTTKPKGSGTGLGLSMVHGFAEQSGGVMTISSEHGQGSTITLTFPALTAKASSVAV